MEMFSDNAKSVPGSDWPIILRLMKLGWKFRDIRAEFPYLFGLGLR
jgi:hypothetical protein